jgi:hypothetical protein
MAAVRSRYDDVIALVIPTPLESPFFRRVKRQSPRFGGSFSGSPGAASIGVAYASELDPVDCAERRHCLSRSLGRREVRGNVLREEYDDLKRRIDAADVMSESACFNHIRSTFGLVSEGHALARQCR